jgi:hypothetical protein
VTKEQKVKNVTDIVEEARRFYTQQEFSNMVFAIWQGLDGAKIIAVDGGVNDPVP